MPIPAELVVIDGEQPADFQALHEDIIGQFNPLPGAEDQLLSLITACLWRLRRILGFEAPFALTAQSAGICRDPRVDQLIKDKITHVTLTDASTKRLAAEIRRRAGEAPNDCSDAVENEDLGRRMHDEFEKLLPQNSDQLSPGEIQEKLVKISSYNNALTKVLARLINILVGLQSMRSHKLG